MPDSKMILIKSRKPMIQITQVKQQLLLHGWVCTTENVMILKYYGGDSSEYVWHICRQFSLVCYPILMKDIQIQSFGPSFSIVWFNNGGTVTHHPATTGHWQHERCCPRCEGAGGSLFLGGACVYIYIHSPVLWARILKLSRKT